MEFAIPESVCGQSVECNSKEHAADTNNPTKDELDSGRRVKKSYVRQNILDNYGRTAGCPGYFEIGQHTEECRARIEQEMVDKGDAIDIETGEEIVEAPDANLKKRKIGEPDINPGGAS